MNAFMDHAGTVARGGNTISHCTGPRAMLPDLGPSRSALTEGGHSSQRSYALSAMSSGVRPKGGTRHVIASQILPDLLPMWLCRPH